MTTPETSRRAGSSIRSEPSYRTQLPVRRGSQLRQHVEVHVDTSESAAAAWTSRLFTDAAEQSAFYRAGSVALSPTRQGGLEAVRLEARRWPTRPVLIRSVASSFYDALPPGSALADNALLMRDLDVIWHREVAPAP